MIRIENTEIVGWEAAIRGMRNPLNSWAKSDSYWTHIEDSETLQTAKFEYFVGDNDLALMRKLRNAGTDHRKFMRMIVVYVDITSSLYFFKEFDTYKIGTVANSCSTMHKIHAKEFTLDDFSHEHLIEDAIPILKDVIEALNDCRDVYINYEKYIANGAIAKDVEKKLAWWQMIQLLPSSYNQKRTVMLNDEVLANMYNSRKDHKLDEWRDLCKWIETLPYSELITGKDELNG